MTDVWLVLLGFVVGAFGTMIGAGGGFILVPVLLFLYPNDPPDVITAISLAVVFFNAASGSAAYARTKRIDYRSALIFAAASVPGAIIGVWSTHLISRHTFEPIFGAGLIAVALYLLFKKGKKEEVVEKGGFHRTLTDANGHHYSYSYSLGTGVTISVVVGFVSSFLGIGGGVIHVPAMAHVLGFPTHIATATSHFVLAITALVGTIEHGFRGSLQPGLTRLVFLAPGVVVGAQVGAWLSHKIHGKWILRSLAIALVLVGLRLIF